MKVEVVSFGYKFKKKYPNEVDCRDLRNPHHDPKLKMLTGLDKPVADYVMESPGVTDIIQKANRLLTTLRPFVSFGCVGGKHRSVAIAEQ